MPIIAIASTKGGCGKSTTAIALACAFIADGYRVHIIDADRSGRLMRWADANAKPDSIAVSRADNKTIRTEIECARSAADLVLIDVEGSANLSAALAIGFSDAVLVPANQSAPDVEDAIGTIGLVRDAQAMTGRAIPHAIVWSRVPTAIRSREMNALAEQIGQAGIAVIGQLYERVAYKALFSFATTLDRLPDSEVPGVAKAQADAAQLALAVADLIRGNLDPQTATQLTDRAA